MEDLFLNNKLTKEQLLEKFCKKQGFFSTADIMQYAIDNYYLRAKRTINDFVKEGKVRRLSKDECIFRNLKTSCAMYEYADNSKYLR